MEKEVIAISGDSDTAPSFDEEGDSGATAATRHTERDGTKIIANNNRSDKDQASTNASTGSTAHHPGAVMMEDETTRPIHGGRAQEKTAAVQENLVSTSINNDKYGAITTTALENHGNSHSRRVSNEGERVDNQGLQERNTQAQTGRKEGANTVSRKVFNLGDAATNFTWEQATPFDSYQQEQASLSQESSSQANYTANEDDDEDQDSLVGRNGSQYNVNPNIGKFGTDSSSDDDDIDSSDDEFYRQQHTRVRRSKSVIMDDVLMEGGTPEKKKAASKNRAMYESPPVSSERETPKSISPFDDSDDSDFSVSAPTTKLKKKGGNNRKRKKAGKTVAAKLPIQKSPDKKAAIQRAVAEHSPGIQKLLPSNQNQPLPANQKMLVSFKTTGASAPKNKPPPLKEGEQVYAMWAKNDWYWGIITAVKRKKNSSYDQYSILFDDGYSLDYVSRKHICTVDEARQKKGKHPPPRKATFAAPVVPAAAAIPPSQAPAAAIANGNRLTPQELHAKRCGVCELCEKPDCGSCATCQRNQQAGTNHAHEACIQKMCLEIPEEQKRQPAYGLLPGWEFIFTRDKRYNGRRNYVPGLFIINPDKPDSYYRSIDGAVNTAKKLLDNNANVIADFNRYAGITPSHYRTAEVWQGKSASKAPIVPIATPANVLKGTEGQTACGACGNCTKDACGKCARCTSSPNGVSQHCFQKMCFMLPPEVKALPAVGFPEEGWMFYFAEHPKVKGKAANQPVPGLFILKKLAFGKKYRSVEAAVAVSKLEDGPEIARTFYTYVGLPEFVPSGQTADSCVPSAPSLPSTTAATDEVSGENSTIACGTCANCAKDACGKCAMCTSNPRGDCFQKMCFKLPPEVLAKRAIGFPKGWKFYFAQNKSRSSSSYDVVPGLFILSKGGKTFRSVKSAVGTIQSLRNEARIARTFYSHVGLHDQIASRTGPAPRQHSDADRMAEPNPPETSLSKYRTVGSRVYCEVGDEGHWGIITDKKEVAPNEYEFTVRCEQDNCLLKELDSESVLSEFHYKKHIGMDPPPHPLSAEYASELLSDSDQSEQRPYKKQKTDASLKVTTTLTTDHFLVGKRYEFAWTNLLNQSKVVYGTVVECEKKNDEVSRFKVIYDDASRELANSIENDCTVSVPESQMVPVSLALGGCIRFEQQANTATLLQEIGRRMHHCTWITPKLRKEELRNSADGKRLPHLTLAVRGFQLEFNVKPSTISGAGFGVFLKITSLAGDNVPFVLRAGELVDLGVYAPFRIQDKKPEAVFFAKNFIHSYEPECWTFYAGDSRYHLDITDDVTGEIHSEAKKHIHAYVNESEFNERVCIRAEHDAEGGVHYLLGHADASQGPFSIPSDGTTEVEIFVNYGEEYEKIRVRKGYGFYPEKKSYLLKVLKYEDVADVKELNEFGSNDIEACVAFLLNLFSKEADFASVVIERALIVAAVFQRRAQQLFLEQRSEDTAMGDGTSSSNVNMKKLLKVSESLVVLLLDMADSVGQLKELQAAGNVDGVLAHVLKEKFSDKKLSKLTDLMSF